MQYCSTGRCDWLLFLLWTISLTTVVLITAIRAVKWVVTPPGLRDALPISASKLKGCTWRGRTTQLLRLVPPISAVNVSIAKLVSGQAGVGRPTGEGGAVLAGCLVTSFTTVVNTFTKEMERCAPSAAAGELIFLRPCEEWEPELEQKLNLCKTSGLS